MGARGHSAWPEASKACRRGPTGALPPPATAGRTVTGSSNMRSSSADTPPSMALGIARRLKARERSSYGRALCRFPPGRMERLCSRDDIEGEPFGRAAPRRGAGGNLQTRVSRVCVRLDWTAERGDGWLGKKRTPTPPTPTPPTPTPTPPPALSSRRSSSLRRQHAHGRAHARARPQRRPPSSSSFSIDARARASSRANNATRGRGDTERDLTRRSPGP